MLKYQEEFPPLDIASYDQKAQEPLLRRLRKQVAERGLDLVQRKEAG